MWSVSGLYLTVVGVSSTRECEMKIEEKDDGRAASRAALPSY